MSENNTLLDVSNLKIAFKTDEGIVKAVDGVSFMVKAGKTLGIVGESGSGKSVTTKAIVQLLPKNAVINEKSSINLTQKNGQQIDVLSLKPNSRELRKIRGGEIAMIFQEPMASFSPVYTIGNHITEAIRLHRDVTKQGAKEIALKLLEQVGISNPEVRFDQYPFELSGGMRQRAMIAIALSTNPSILIADEPTTALDVTIQAQILELMKDIQDQFGMSIIFITHDLGVISQVADELAVMYLGKIVETGTTRDVLDNAKHPYTQSLLTAIPRIDLDQPRLNTIPGDIPSPLERPNGCPFHTRCSQRIEGVCDTHIPGHTVFENYQTVNCWLYEDYESLLQEVTHE